MASAIFGLILLIYGNHVKDSSSSVNAHEHVLFFACLSIDLPQSLLKVCYLQARHMHTFSFVWNYGYTFTNIVMSHGTGISVNKSKLLLRGNVLINFCGTRNLYKILIAALSNTSTFKLWSSWLKRLQEWPKNGNHSVSEEQVIEQWKHHKLQYFFAGVCDFF